MNRGHLNNPERYKYSLVFQNISELNKLLLLSIIAFFSGLLLIGEVAAAPAISDWFNNITQDNVTAFTANETDSIFFNVTVSETVNYSWYRNGSIVGSNQSNWTWNTNSSTDGDWNITVVVNNSNGENSSEWIVTVKEEIQVLIDALPTSGGTVNLEAKTYWLGYGAPILVNKSNITIQGAGSTESGTVINMTINETVFTVHSGNKSSGWSSTGSAFYGKLDNVTLKNLYIYGTRTNKCNSPQANGSIYIGKGHIYMFDVENSTIQNIHSTESCADGIHLRNTYNITIKDSEFHHEKLRGILNAGKGSHIFNITFYNQVSAGISLNRFYGSGYISDNTMNDNIFENNTFYDFFENRETILLYSSSTNSIVRNNTMYNCGRGVTVELTTYNVIEKNTIWDCDYGVNLFTSSGNSTQWNTIKNNIIYNTTDGGPGIGIQLSQPSSGNGIWYTTITSNTIYNSSSHGISLGANTMFTNITNNIIVNSNGYGLYVADNEGGQSQNQIDTANYNLYFNNNNGDYLNASAGANDVNGLDPLFADELNHDFHLQSTAGRWNGTDWVTDSVHSPTIDAGDPTSDYSNEQEDNGDRINIGAYGNTIYASKSAGESTPPQLSFFLPTPGNGASLSSTTSSVTINVSIAEDNPDKLVFNWNGNNETYDYNAGYWNITKSVSAGSSYSFYVWANDTLGYSNQTGVRSFTVQSSSDGSSPSGGGGGGTKKCITEGFQSLGTSLMKCVITELNLQYKLFYSVEKILASILALTGDILGEYPAPTDTEVQRILANPMGSLDGDVYQLSAERVSKRWTFSNTVIIARGDLEVDSMAALAFAKTNKVPILLTRPTEIPDVTMSTLEKLNPKRIIIVGGPVAVSKEVEAELEKIAPVERIWGENREETAVEVAKRTDGTKAIDTIVIADGRNASADAVFIANGYRAPIVYVSEKKLPKVTRDFLEQHKRTSDVYRKPMKVVFVGVSEEVQSEIEDLMRL